MHFKPLRDTILIKQVLEPSKTEGGIILQPSDNDELRGRVVAVGGPFTNERGVDVQPPVKAGDIVVFRKYTGTVVKLSATDYYLAFSWNEVLGVIDPD